MIKIIFSVVLLASGNTSSAANIAKTVFSHGAMQAIRFDGKTAGLAGMLSNNEDEFKTFVQATSGAKLLLLNSGGGSVIQAIRIAEFVQANQIDVRVQGACLSACATIFMAGNKKTIAPKSLLGMHAGTIDFRYGLFEEIESMPEDIKKTRLLKRITATSVFKENISKEIIRYRQVLKNAGVSYKAIRNIDRATSQTKNIYFYGEDHGNISELKPAQNQGCDWWIPDREKLAEIGVFLDEPYTPDSQLFMTIDGTKAVANETGKISYTGSAFDVDMINSVCGVNVNDF